jgi:hypothetical protein
MLGLCGPGDALDTEGVSSSNLLSPTVNLLVRGPFEGP